MSINDQKDGGSVRWRQWLRTSVRLCNLPEDSRVCITLYCKNNSSTSAIANVNCSLFDFKDHFRTGNSLHISFLIVFPPSLSLYSSSFPLSFIFFSLFSGISFLHLIFLGC